MTLYKPLLEIGCLRITLVSSLKSVSLLEGIPPSPLVCTLQLQSPTLKETDDIEKKQIAFNAPPVVFASIESSIQI